MKRNNSPVVPQEGWLLATLGSIGDALIATDLEGVVVFMNARAEDLTGWSTTDALGKTLSEVVQIADDTDREMQALLRRS